MLRILGQLASSVAIVFAAEALLGTTYLAGFLSGFGVPLTTIRLDPGTAVINALVPSIYLAPAGLIAFGYVFSVAVGLAAPDDDGSHAGLARKGIRARYFDEQLLEGVGYALVAAAISVAILYATLVLVNLPRSIDVLLVNVIAPAGIAVLLIFPAHWLVNGTRFQPPTRVWWATLAIIIWAILSTVVTYVLGTAVARSHTDELASQADIGAQVTIRDAIPTVSPTGRATALGATTYDGVVLLFRDDQAWLFAIRDTSAPRGFRTVVVPAVQVIAFTSR